jgi:8-oxo-dGTP pyrophosphatase MutT (NUDIX family)
MSAAPDLSFGDALRDRIAAHLAAFARLEHDDDALKRAAVALTVVEGKAGEGAFVLTRRSSRLKRHKGQWALPGGRMDPGETVVEAALRELHEEVCLDLGPDAVLGLLDDYPTRSGYLITPVVVWAGPGADMTANPDEVETIHRIAFRDLFRRGSPEFVSIPQSDRPVIRMPIAGSKIHAPTAAFIYQFREVALSGLDTRVAHLEQPVFAWR